MSGVTTNRLLTSPSTRRSFVERSTWTACCKNDGCVAAVTWAKNVSKDKDYDVAYPERTPTSSRMPFASRILTAPLWYISRWPITPSTCAGGFSLSTSSGTGAGGFVSAENETCLTSLVEAMIFSLGSEWADVGETNVGKGVGNWKKYRRSCFKPC